MNIIHHFDIWGRRQIYLKIQYNWNVKINSFCYENCLTHSNGERENMSSSFIKNSKIKIWYRKNPLDELTVLIET